MKRLTLPVATFIVATLLPSTVLSSPCPREKKEVLDLSFSELGERKGVSLHGSRCSIRYQAMTADFLRLPLAKDYSGLQDMESRGILSRLDEEEFFRHHPEFDQRHRVLVGWAKRNTELLAQRFWEELASPLPLNSACRPISFQHELREENGNAISPEGEFPSSHPRCATVDIGKFRYHEGITTIPEENADAVRDPLSDEELKWLRRELLLYEENGCAEVTEENSQAVFHVMWICPLDPADLGEFLSSFFFLM